MFGMQSWNRVAVVVLMLGCTSALRADLIDNFDDGDVEGWYFDDLESGAAEVVDGELRLFSTAPVEGRGCASMSWLGSFDDKPSFHNGTLRARVRSTDTAVLLLARLTEDGQNCNWVVMRPTDGLLAIGSVRFGNVTLLNGANAGFANDQDWFLELTVIDTAVSAKAWPVGGEKPEVPQVFHATGAVSNEGGVSLYIERPTDLPPPVSLDAYFDEVEFDHADPQCEDVKKFKGRCKGSGKINAKVVLTSEDFDGRIVTIDLAGNVVEMQVSGNRAKTSVCCFSPGTYDLSLISPAGCEGSPVQVTCD